MESQIYQASQSYHQQKPVSVFFPMAAPPGTQYVIAQPAQEYFTAPEMHHNWGKPTNSSSMPLAPTYAQQCVVVVTDSAVSHGNLTLPEQQRQQYAFFGAHDEHQKHHFRYGFYGACDASPPELVSNLFGSSQVAALPPITDSRLNPNSQEFIKRPDKETTGASTPATRDGESWQSSLRKPSSECIESKLDAKLRKVNSRYRSADSGVVSAGSAVSSSDDDVDNTKSSVAEENKTLEEDKKRLWDGKDEEKYWRSVPDDPPSYGFCCVIVEQLEFYLSDEYLSKDKYLLRQVRCKKDGYVSVKLLTSFKKMKKLAKDWPVLRSAIFQASSTLVVSGEGMRIRRVEDLPKELLKPRPIFCVLAIRLPDIYNAVDQLSLLFRLFGELKSVALIRPDNEVPPDMRNYATQVPDIGRSTCAVLEFESAADALTSVRVIQHRNRKCSLGDSKSVDDDDSGCRKKEAELSCEDESKLKRILEGMPDLEDTRVALLGPRIRRTLYRQDRLKSVDVASDPLEAESLTSESNANRGQLSKFRSPTSNASDASTLWRMTRSSVVMKNPTNVCNVRRQPRGTRDVHGFQLRRSVAEK